MKIGFIGDPHFGNFSNLAGTCSDTHISNRLLDFSNTFNGIVDQHLNNNVKNIVICGDVYDSRSPTAEQVKAFSRCVRRAIDLGVSFVIISGNHDQQRQISTTTIDMFDELKIPEISVFTKIGVFSYNSKCHLVLLPYLDRRMLGVKSNQEALDIIKGDVEKVTEGLTGTKIAVCHFMLEQAVSGEVNPDSFSMSEIILTSDVFDDFSAIISGHIHKPNIIRENDPVIIYTGSMDKISFGERDHIKSSIILDTGDINNYQILETKTRDMYEIFIDLSETSFKKLINDKIFEHIDEFDQENGLEESLVKVIIKSHENDLYFISQPRIKEYILNKKAKHCSSISVSVPNVRMIRQNSIAESESAVDAVKFYIQDLKETDETKDQLIKEASKIIKAVGE